MDSLSPDDLLTRLRSKHAGATTKDAELMAAAADCIEQLQMPPAKVRELAQTDEGADSLALIRAMSLQIEGQRKHIAALESRKRLRQLLSPIEWDHLKDWHKNSVLTCQQVDDFVGARVHRDHLREMQDLEKRS